MFGRTCETEVCTECVEHHGAAHVADLEDLWHRACDVHTLTHMLHLVVVHVCVCLPFWCA